MSAKTKVSALDHAMQTAHTWINDVAREFDTEDREFAYRVLRAWLHTLRDRLTVEASAHFAAQLPDLIRGIFYAAGIPAPSPRCTTPRPTLRGSPVRRSSPPTTSARRLRRPPQPYCTISRLPRWTRPWISSPEKSAPYCKPSGELAQKTAAPTRLRLKR